MFIQVLGSIFGAIALHFIIEFYQDNVGGLYYCDDLMKKGQPFGNNIPSLYHSDYNRSGLDHITIVGAHHHGMKKIEVWQQAFVPGLSTPIHRHDCEEVFIVLSGQAEVKAKIGESVVTYEIKSNDTLVLPPNIVHQVLNSGVDLVQLLVVISNPPMKVFIFRSWDEDEEQLVSPMLWDRICPQS
eukprot:TRINITY_DN8007_c0_g1_i2.p1 TRINITY_DN8007_c0_g1~~TRINITY_DN8007_c0_g1_i2.p1  ORF type:complete len:185 (+),score=20.04 TRINITY_DN8007_c0_g1_i2:28-582(+)